MSAQPATPAIAPKTARRAPPAPAIAIAVIAGAQLMVALDRSVQVFNFEPTRDVAETPEPSTSTGATRSC